MHYLKSLCLIIVVTITFTANVSAQRVDYHGFEPGIGASMPDTFFAAKDSSLATLIERVNNDSMLMVNIGGIADGLECDDATNVNYAWSRALIIKNRAIELGLSAEKINSIQADIKSDTGAVYRSAWIEEAEIKEHCTSDTVTVYDTTVVNHTTTVYDTTTQSIELFTSLNAAATYSKLGYGLGVNMKFGFSTFYLDGTATASVDTENLLLAINAAYPISSQMTLLVGGSSNVRSKGDDLFRKYLYSFNSGLEMNFGKVSLRAIWTPGRYKADGLDSKIDLNAFTVQCTVKGLNINL